MLWSWFALAGLVGWLVTQWAAYILCKAASTSETGEQYYVS